MPGLSSNGCTRQSTFSCYTLLDKKLDEELKEYQESKSMEELADLLEVMHAVSIARGSSIEEVEKIRVQKAENRGSFEKRILLP